MRGKLRWAALAGVMAGVAVATSGALAGAAPRAATTPHPTITPREEIGDDGEGARVPPGCREVRQEQPAGWLYLPTQSMGKETRPPAVVMLHKGFAYDHERARRVTRNLGRLYASHLCALGIAVRSVDYRASALGREEIDDVAAAYDSLARRGSPVDAGRIAVMGGSHGAYMTLLALAQHRRPFAAGVALYGFADVASVLERRVIDNPSTRATILRLGDPRRHPSRYRAVTADVARIDRPLLLVTGDHEQFLPDMRAIHAAKRDAEYVEIVGGRHGFEAGRGRASAQLWERVSVFLTAVLAPAVLAPAGVPAGVSVG